jgi:hypothetical protein
MSMPSEDGTKYICRFKTLGKPITSYQLQKAASNSGIKQKFPVGFWIGGKFFLTISNIVDYRTR